MKDSYGKKESKSIQIIVSTLSIHHEGPRQEAESVDVSVPRKNITELVPVSFLER